MTETQNMKISTHCVLACMYFLLLPTTIAVNSAGNSILKIATIPIAAYFVITIIFSKKILQLNSVHLLLCIFTFSMLVPLFVKSDDASINTVVGYFLNAALFLCITVVQYNKKELILLENVQVLLLCVLVGLTLFASGKVVDRTTLMIFGQTSDPNYFVGFFVFPLTITLKKIVQSKYRILYVILALLSVYCVFLSGSRGGLLAIVVTIIAFAMIYPPKIRTKIFLCLTGFGFVLLAWLVVAPFLPENITERMTLEQVLETGGSGRWDIWKSMLNEIMNSSKELLFGRGFETKHQLFIGGKRYLVVAHNHVIQIIYNNGILGLMTFAVLAIGCLLRCIRKRKTVAIAIIGMMALSVSLSFNPTTRTFWNLIAYAALNFPEKECFVSTEEINLSEED